LEKGGRFDLPGIGKEHVEIGVNEDVLTVKGEKKGEEKKEDTSYLYSECPMDRLNADSSCRIRGIRM
jgi:HSP20 family molecular chaperone IbpA